MTAQTPIRLDTLGALAEHGYGLIAHCRSCNRHQPLDVFAMADRLGHDHPSAGEPCPIRLTCSACGGRDVGVLVSSPIRGPVSRASG